jgi:hypothetical protein
MRESEINPERDQGTAIGEGGGTESGSAGEIISAFDGGTTASTSGWSGFFWPLSLGLGGSA